MKWEDQLWIELEAMDPQDRVVAISAIITHMSQNILSQLGDQRRILFAQLYDEGQEYSEIADSIGARVGAVRRLAEEGRRVMRDREKAVA